MPAIDSSPSDDKPSNGMASVGGDGEPEGTIESLTTAVRRLRRGAAALKAENSQLRAELAELQLAASARPASQDYPLGKLTEVDFPTGPSAPGAARMVVAHCLMGLVAPPVLRDAELLVSELVTNSVKHGELSQSDVVRVGVYLAAETLRLESRTRAPPASSSRARPTGGFRRAASACSSSASSPPAGACAAPPARTSGSRWDASLLTEMSRCPPRSFDGGLSLHLGFAAVEDLLHSLVDPCVGRMRDVADGACVVGGVRLQGHQ
jgi:hypothetical protein